MCSIHEMSTDHREHNTVSVLSREFHTLLELVLKYCGVKTEKINIKKHKSQKHFYIIIV
jgi:septum formation topological specificity factor MinE